MESSLILIKGCLTLLRTLRNKGLSLGSRNYTVKAKPHSRTLAPIPFYIQRHWGSESWTMLVELHLNMPLPASNALPPCPILQLLLMTSLPFCLEPPSSRRLPHRTLMIFQPISGKLEERTWEVMSQLLSCDIGLWQALEAHVNVQYVSNALHILTWLIFTQPYKVGTISITLILKIAFPRSHN